MQRLDERRRRLLERTHSRIYREIEGGDDLAIHFYLPRGLEDGAARPALLFFNDGAWDRGNVVQFAPHALHYAGRGAVCGLVTYRNRRTHPDSTPWEALGDARAAIRFVRHRADSLKVDPARIVTIGAGAGAHIAAGAAMKVSGSPTGEGGDASGSQPDAAVLLSAIFDPGGGGYGRDAFAGPAEARRAALPRHVAPELPPMLILHGTADRLVPFAEASAFAAKMVRKKNGCELVEFEGRDRNFFNFNVDPASFEAVLTCLDDFLERRGFLAGGGEGDDSRIVSRRDRDY